MSPGKTIVLVDCNFLGYQALWTMPDLTYRGEPTGVICGFLIRLVALARILSSNEFCFCWDSKTNHREALLPSYKGQRNRGKSPKEIQQIEDAYYQFALLRREILPDLGFRNVFCQRGYEADDLIAGICHDQLVSDIVIVSADHDLFQLLAGSRIRLYNPSKREWWSEKRMRETYGVSPKQFITVKALAGCDSDNIPGVKGVGTKRAVAFVTGNMTDGIHHEQIVDFMKMADEFERNIKLITLPFNDPEFPFRTPILKPDQTASADYSRIFGKYGLEMLQKQPDWKRVFIDGRFQSEEPNPIITRRPSRN